MQTLFWIFLGVTLLGMFRPWWVLWFLDRQNRLLVLKYFGSITALLGLAVLVAKQLVG